MDWEFITNAGRKLAKFTDTRIILLYEGVLPKGIPVSSIKILDEGLPPINVTLPNGTVLPEKTITSVEFNGRKYLVVEGAVKIGADLIRGVKKSNFIKSVEDFTTNPQLAEEAWILFKNEEWTGLENLINTNNINGGWPPNNGFRNITHIESGSELSNKIFDRFQIDEDLGGSFASPVNSGGGVGDLVFTYDSRALKYQISEGTYYIKFKIKNNIPSDLRFEYGDAIPWFNASGNAVQIKSNYNFGNLTEGVDYDIIERQIYKNGQWFNIP